MKRKYRIKLVGTDQYYDERDGWVTWVPRAEARVFSSWGEAVMRLIWWRESPEKFELERVEG